MTDGAGIGIEKAWSWKIFFLQWEWLLVLVLLLVFIVNTIISPYFLTVYSLVQTPATFLDKAFIVFPMMLVIILGRIDISVGSTVAISAVVMAIAYNAGLPMPLAMALCLVVGTAGGAINGILMVKFKELSFVIVTLSTMIIYRGIAYIILGDQASGGFPDWYSFLGWGSVAGIPFIFLAFIAVAIVFGILLHKTKFGRTVYGMGFNSTTCEYSGIDTNRVTLIVFTLAGLMAAVTALFLTSRMGSTRPNVAMGYELEVITMVALGGVSTSGGIGKIGGPILAVFIIGYLSYGMGLANIQAPVVLVVIGSLLIFSVLAMKVRISPKVKKSAM
ncbi:MAG: ABC transporter permease [Spirochaetaceae bacterium]|nr:ABC transporter permease [Spirochaetaceae bacterium]